MTNIIFCSACGINAFENKFKNFNDNCCKECNERSFRTNIIQFNFCKRCGLYMSDDEKDEESSFDTFCRVMDHKCSKCYECDMDNIDVKLVKSNTGYELILFDKDTMKVLLKHEYMYTSLEEAQDEFNRITK